MTFDVKKNMLFFKFKIILKLHQRLQLKGLKCLFYRIL
ncbi:hypothetical protein FM106_31085 [Brachybacterium faecium]|nr:hypothetical protein FM106_31085 [Brachybacterium faecium]